MNFDRNGSISGADAVATVVDVVVVVVVAFGK